MAQCDVLLGPHGAGMTHLVWMARAAHADGTPPALAGPTPTPRAALRGAAVELVGLSHEGRATHMYYYEHLAALAGLDYVLVKEP